MKKKILHISAIIPKELYIKRDADRKLAEIIQLMSKPAYISVARQMGKTNLLINTKRELENANNRFVFIDVTNSFKKSQDCFRYIIDQILNANEDILEFKEAAKIIRDKRQQQGTVVSTEEYQNEIRTILKQFKGNLIVFLDEVDDLRKHSFSDEIFGQIRKTYFIRETYSELKRITYVLSGVIDPEKLIKTKENSPFNIAIPLYLEDFNYSEFLEFVGKSDLDITEESKRHIYNWLNGNPRMTFDIMSQIEDEFINGHKITIELINKVIDDIYLSSFKNPPIDHIRDLIKHNTEVRKALINLKQGITSELSDEIINKLYLFGIISSKLKRETITIKNKVIELSLSDEWLQKVELEKKGYFDVGKEKIDSGLYEEGINYLKEYLQNEPKGSGVEFAKFSIGKAYNKAGEFIVSNQYLLEKPIRKETSSDIYYWQIFYIGVNYIKLNKIEDSLNYFEEIIKDCKIPQIYINALVNKGEILLPNKGNDFSKSEEIYLSAHKYINDNIDKIEESEKLYTIILFRLGYLHQRKADSKKALEYFEQAMKYATAFEIPEIKLFIDSCISDSAKRRELYSQLVNHIIKEHLEFKLDENVIKFNENNLLLIFSNLVTFDLSRDYNSLLKYSLSSIYQNKIRESELLFRIGTFALNNSDLKVTKKLFLQILKFPEPDLLTLKTINLILGLITSNEKQTEVSLKYLTKYAHIFKDNNNFGQQIELLDINAFTELIANYRKNQNMELSYITALIIEPYLDENISQECKANSVIIFYFIMDYFAFIGEKEKLKLYGDKVLRLVSEVKPFLNELNYVDKQGLEAIEKQTNNLLKLMPRIGEIKPIKVDREPGRNEYVTVKYKNGQESTKKYKNVEDDIKNGNCVLLNRIND